jgi:cobalt-zinc-cadmium efflux system outer membrane protein
VAPELPIMIKTKEGWPRSRSPRLLAAVALAATLHSSGCHRLTREVYFPAPTPLFMEEGLRTSAEEPGTLREANRAQGISGKLNPARVEIANAAHSSDVGIVIQPELRPPTPPPLQPPTQPPQSGPQPAMPEFLPAGPSPNPYETLPGAMAIASGVTLAQAIDEALNSSVEVRASLENVVQSQADVQTAGLLPNPALLMLPSLQQWPNHVFSPTRQGGPPQYDITTFWPIDWYLFGKRQAAIEAAARQVDVTAAEFADFARQRVALTVATFFGVLEAKALLQVARENTANLERVEEHTRKRLDAGQSPTIDLDRAQIVLANSRRDIRTAEATLTATRAQLRALMGRQGLDPAFDVAGSLQTAQAVAPPPVEFALTVAEQWRPDMLAAWRKIEQTEALVGLEDAKRFPPVAVQAGWTYQDQFKAIGFPGQPSWNLGVATTLPLWDRNQGNRSKARSALTQAQIALEARRIQVRSEVEQALAAYEAAYRIVTSESPRQLEAARSVRNRMEESYQIGGRSLFELLDAERTYRDTFRLQINAEVSYWRAIHQLNAVVGQQIVP